MKNFKLSILQVSVILGVLSIIAVYLFTKYVDNAPKNSISGTVSNKVASVIDKIGESRDQTETNVSPQIVGIDPEEHAKTLKALDIKESQILALTNTQAQLQDSLKLLKISRDAANYKVWQWENKKPSGSTIKASMNEKDSILHASVDVKLNSTDFIKKGGLFKKDKIITDFYSPDQNIKINGAQTFRKETFIRPKRIGIGLQAGYGISGDLKPIPYVGVGISYNILNF